MVVGLPVIGLHTWNNGLATTFEEAPLLLTVDTRSGGRAVHVKPVGWHPGSATSLVSWLHQLGVRALVVRAMGHHTLCCCLLSGIRIYAAQGTRVDAQVVALSTGQLEPATSEVVCTRPPTGRPSELLRFPGH